MTVRSARLAALCALLALATPGCDLLASADLLGDASTRDLADLADLTAEFFDCEAAVDALGSTARGTLESGDCLQTDDSYVDFYAFTVEETADVTVEMESADFPPYLFLLGTDLGGEDEIFELQRDENTSESDVASIRRTLAPGLYLVYANAATADDEGRYTLNITADAENEGGYRPAPRGTGTGTK